LRARHSGVLFLDNPIPFGAALRAIGDAGATVETDDQVLLERGLFVYDALYAYCQREVLR
jgi:hypothetical protein